MPSKRRVVYLGWFVLHFTIVVMVCSHETLWLISKRLTVVPPSGERFWKALDTAPAAFLGKGLAGTNLYRRVITTYTNAAGIEVGYGYFAPNVPITYALVFEFHYPGGRVEYQTPAVQGGEAELRLTSLLDAIGRSDYDPWRAELTKLAARSTGQQHPGALSVRAFLGSITPPTLTEFCRGKKKRLFTCLSIYDFTLDNQKAAPPTRE